MKKLNIKKISIILIVLIIAGAFAMYNYINSNNHNKFIAIPNNCTKNSNTNNVNTHKYNTSNNQQQYKNSSKKDTNNVSSKILNSKDAENIVKKLINPSSNENTKVQFDHEQNVNGVNYFVIHVYDLIKDNENISHSATKGWYYVNPSTGKVFDGTLGDLESLN